MAVTQARCILAWFQGLTKGDTMQSTDPHHARRWKILGVIALAQLMVVLDVTIINIALPSAQADLGFDDDSRQGSTRRMPSRSAHCCFSAERSAT